MSARRQGTLPASFPSLDTIGCPYPWYESLRDNAPVYMPPDGEGYVVSRDEDIRAIARLPAIFSNRHSLIEDCALRATTLDDLQRPYAWPIGTSDPPQHTWKRAVAAEIFKPRRLARHEPSIRRYADELIDGFADRGEAEFVSEFARLLPTKVILAVFDIPQTHLERAREWAEFTGSASRFSTPERREAESRAIADITGFLEAEVFRRLEANADDELTRYVGRHTTRGGRRDLAHVVAELSMLLIGGMVTTTHLMSSMMRLLVANEDQMLAARNDPKCLAAAIEETLRYEAPVQFSMRLAAQDAEIGGVKIPAGSTVFLVWGSSGRDAAVFHSPDMFDLHRTDYRRHLSFGHGLHFCLGAPLVRLETRLAFEQLFSRLTNFTITGDVEPAMEPIVTFRAPSRLHLRFDRAPV